VSELKVGEDFEDKVTSSGGRMDKDYKSRRQDSEVSRVDHPDARYESRDQRYESHEKRDGRREKSDHRQDKKDHRYESEHRSDRRSRDDRKHRAQDDDDRVDSSRREKRRPANQEEETRSSRHYENESRSSKSHDQESRKHESEKASRGSDHSSHSSRSSRQSEQRSSKQESRSTDSDVRRHQRREDDSSSLIPDMQGMSISYPVENPAYSEPKDVPVVEEPPVPKVVAKKKFASKMRSIVSAVKTAQRLEKSRHQPTDATFVPRYASEDIVRSGHMDYNTLYASNDQETGDLTVNLINAPNDSTLQCGCENINCPFCNLMMSIGSSDTTILQ